MNGAATSGVSARALRDFAQATRGGPFRVALLLSLIAHLALLVFVGWGNLGRGGGNDRRSTLMHVRLLPPELAGPAAPAVRPAVQQPRREPPGSPAAAEPTPPPAISPPAPETPAPSVAYESAPAQETAVIAREELRDQQALAPTALTPVAAAASPRQPQPPGIAASPAPVIFAGEVQTSPVPAAGVQGTDSAAPSPLPATVGSGSGGSTAARLEREGQEALGTVRRRIDAHKVYPQIAVRNGWEGRVLVEMRLEGDGSLTAVRLLEGSGYAVLDDATITAVRRAAPFPPVARVLAVPVEYRLIP